MGHYQRDRRSIAPYSFDGVAAGSDHRSLPLSVEEVRGLSLSVFDGPLHKLKENIIEFIDAPSTYRFKSGHPINLDTRPRCRWLALVQLTSVMKVNRNVKRDRHKSQCGLKCVTTLPVLVFLVLLADWSAAVHGNPPLLVGFANQTSKSLVNKFSLRLRFILL
jgi:hypothetical protein